MLEVPTLGSAYPPHMPPMLCCRACSPRPTSRRSSRSAPPCWRCQTWLSISPSRATHALLRRLFSGADLEAVVEERSAVLEVPDLAQRTPLACHPCCAAAPVLRG